MNISRLIVPAFGMSLLFAAGCAHEQTTQPQTAQVPVKSAPAPAPVAPPAQAYNGAGVSVSGDLVKACNLVFSEPQRAPKFDFDQSSLEPQDRDVLDQIAKCVTIGPLKGRSLKLIGRADPRGEEEYNFALGERRADSVGDYLGGLGVSKAKIVETSRGKLDAQGTDEAGWAHDRRVDISAF